MVYMSLNHHAGFFDPSQISQNIFWLGIGLGLPYIWKKLVKNYQFKLNKHQIWRNFQWFKIGCHAVSFLIWGYVHTFGEIFYFKHIEKGTEKILLYHFKSGFAIFKKLEPEMAEYIFNKLKELATKSS